jgi:hypothetical protein
MMIGSIGVFLFALFITVTIGVVFKKHKTQWTYWALLLALFIVTSFVGVCLLSSISTSMGY